MTNIDVHHWMIGGSGSKRKAKTFKDEEYFISSVPTNHVGYLSLMPSNVLLTFQIDYVCSLSWLLLVKFHSAITFL